MSLFLLIVLQAGMVEIVDSDNIMVGGAGREGGAAVACISSSSSDYLFVIYLLLIYLLFNLICYLFIIIKGPKLTAKGQYN